VGRRTTPSLRGRPRPRFGGTSFFAGTVAAGSNASQPFGSSILCSMLPNAAGPEASGLSAVPG